MFLNYQVRSECLTCTSRTSCCSARLSRAQVPGLRRFLCPGQEKKGEGIRGGGGGGRLHWRVQGGTSSLTEDYYVHTNLYIILRLILHLSYFSFHPVLHDWCNKGLGMCYPVYGMMHIKEPLLLIGKSNPCGGSGFPPSLSEWSFTICVTTYNPK